MRGMAVVTGVALVAGLLTGCGDDEKSGSQKGKDAPKLPAAQAKVVAIVPDLQVKTPFAELSDARLVTPDFVYTVTGVNKVDSVPGSALGQNDTPQLAPAAGERFLLARIASTSVPVPEDPLFNTDVPAADMATEFFILVGDTRTPLPFARGDEQNVLISVPTAGDTPVAFGTRTANKEQTVSLVDGRRTTPHPGMYRTTGRLKVDKTLPPSKQELGQYRGTFGMKIPSVVMTSWDRWRGWAPDGMTWIRVPYQSSLGNPSVFTVKLNPTSFAVSADGKPLEDRTPAQHWRVQNAGAALYLAPGDAKAVHIRVAPVLEIKGGSFTNPPSGSVQYPAIDFDVVFPS
jgi:hypothetical protein